jgi:hypothetical protein
VKVIQRSLRRSIREISMSVLGCCVAPRRVTGLLCELNINEVTFKEALEFLTDRGLLSADVVYGKPKARVRRFTLSANPRLVRRATYVMTERGKQVWLAWADFQKKLGDS